MINHAEAVRALSQLAAPTPENVAIAREFAYKKGLAARPSKPLKDRHDNDRMKHERVFGRYMMGGLDVKAALPKFGLGGAPTDAACAKMGLGACDEATALSRALKNITSCGFMQQPVIEYVRTTFTLPMLDSSIADSFGEKIDIFNPTAPPGSVQSSSFLGNNGTLQVDMFAAGLGIHLYGGPISFAIPGNAVITSTTTPIWSPDVWTQNDLTNGLLGPTAAGSVVPANLEYGGVVHEMLWRMSQAYRVRLYMNQKFIVLDEPLSDFAYFTSYGAAEMQGTSERAIAPFVKEVNANYRSLGSTYIFEPVNARRIGSTTQGGVNVGDTHPTRDFDFADVTYGGMTFEQGGCCKPYHAFPSPILFDRGITIALILEVVDELNFAQMSRLLSISQGVGGTNALVQMDVTVNGFTATAATNAGNELLLDQGANAFAKQSVNTDRMEFEGGTAEMFGGIRGQEFWGDWRSQLKAAAASGLIQAPTITGQWHGTAITA